MRVMKISSLFPFLCYQVEAGSDLLQFSTKIKYHGSDFRDFIVRSLDYFPSSSQIQRGITWSPILKAKPAHYIQYWIQIL